MSTYKVDKSQNKERINATRKVLKTTYPSLQSDSS